MHHGGIYAEEIAGKAYDTRILARFTRYVAPYRASIITVLLILPLVAAYLVPNGFNRRVLFELNLRELFHFIRIRCNPNAHFSIRRVGRAMIEKIQLVHPMFCSQLCVDCSESSETINQKYFTNLVMY